MLLNFIGRGSAFNVKEGNNSAYLKDNGELILLDCGEGIFERILEKEILNDVTSLNIFITHMHSDHVGSLSSLLYYCFYMKKIVPKVYSADDKLLDLLKILGNVEGRDFEFIKLKIEENVSIGAVKISPVKVEHIDSANCYGYLIDYKNKLIWYSGDCRGVSDIINKYDIDEFYQDTCLAHYEGNNHTSLRTLCLSVPKDKRNKIYCMHIDCSELIEKAEQEGFNVVKL